MEDLEGVRYGGCGGFISAWSPRQFSSKVGMMYFGCLMALLRVWEGSRHIWIFPSLVGVGSLSQTTMLDIQSAGCDTRTSWPMLSI